MAVARSVCRRIENGFDERDELCRRLPRPTVTRALVNEMQINALNLGQELAELIQSVLLLGPIELRLPVLQQKLVVGDLQPCARIVVVEIIGNLRRPDASHHRLDLGKKQTRIRKRNWVHVASNEHLLLRELDLEGADRRLAIDPHS